MFFSKVGHKTLFLMRENFFKKNRSINSIVLILFYFIFQNGNGPHFLVVVSVMCLLVLFFFYGAHPEITKRSLGIDMNFFCFYPERNAIINQKLAIVYSVTAACNGIVPKQLSRQTLFLYTHRGLGCWL
jgi:hypothetical protein